jgi:predicted RNA-binding protein YlxR (DUF448 family)
MTAHIAMRTCLVCRSKQPKATLLRLALRQQWVTEDLEQIMPGRGAYVCPRPACLSRLQFDKRLHRAFRGKANGMAQNIGLRFSSEGSHEDRDLGG